MSLVQWRKPEEVIDLPVDARHPRGRRPDALSTNPTSADPVGSPVLYPQLRDTDFRHDVPPPAEPSRFHELMTGRILVRPSSSRRGVADHVSTNGLEGARRNRIHHPVRPGQGRYQSQDPGLRPPQ